MCQCHVTCMLDTFVLTMWPSWGLIVCTRSFCAASGSSSVSAKGSACSCQGTAQAWHAENTCHDGSVLQGHEDLRQDERVMQLFGLVNSMLAHDRTTAERDLSIARYAVIPLSPNSGADSWLFFQPARSSPPLTPPSLLRCQLQSFWSSCMLYNWRICAGLIGWVPNTDTLHALIREYRDARKIPLNVEHRLMLGMAPDYDHLPLINKVEVFQHALDSTSGRGLLVDSHTVNGLQCCCQQCTTMRQG